MPSFTTADDRRIHYDRLGPDASPDHLPLLLLPGMLGSLASQWGEIGQALAVDRCVYRMDLRGHGQNVGGDDTLTLAGMCANVEALVEHLAIPRLHLLGYSLGGYLGMLLAANRPELLASLFMHGTKYYWTDAAVAGVLSQLDPSAIQERLPAYAAQLEAEHGPGWPQLLGLSAGLVSRMPIDGLPEAALPDLKLPILVSVGDRDALVPVDEASRLAQDLPAGQLMVLPGVKHPFGHIPTALLLPAIQRHIATSENLT
jgi:pimeloyl-ACP methyl ester carboxylesterase